MANIINTDLYSSSANQEHNLGELLIDKWGSKYRYVQAGGSTLVTGDLQQSAVTNTNYSSMVVPTAVAIGATTIGVTLGGTAVTANQFESGILVVSKVTGLGQSFKIVSHTVQTSTTGLCTFTVDHPVIVALDTSSTVTVAKSPYDGAIIYPTTSTGKAIGAAIYPIVNAQYGWIQSGGLGAALGDATASTAANQSLSPSVSTAGTVTKQVTLAETVGSSYYVASVSAEVQPVYWTID